MLLQSPISPYPIFAIDVASQPSGVTFPRNGFFIPSALLLSNTQTPLVLSFCNFHFVTDANWSNAEYSVSIDLKNNGSKLRPSAFSLRLIPRCASSSLLFSLSVVAKSPERRADITLFHARRVSQGSCSHTSAIWIGAGG